MPIPTPFHARTSPLCETNEWRTWSGYMAPTSYQYAWEREYWAVRNSVGLLDISPLFKYEIVGPDAERLLQRVMTRDLRKCKVGQVVYSPWCAENGDMIHDGNIVRVAADHFRITTADPMLRWFADCGYGMDVQVRDVSAEMAALALQGPNARKVLQAAAAETDWNNVGYFRHTHARIDTIEIEVTRTGFTGDLGYELWLPSQHAVRIWDRLMAAGAPFGLLPMGLGVLDMLRVEAGLLLIEVDYISAHHAVIDAQKSSPLEAGLGWAVKWDKGDFVGRRALAAQRDAGPEWALVGLTVPWIELERLWGAVDLRPTVVGRGTSRLAVPVCQNGQQVGQATSHLYSPLLKQYIALATVKRAAAALGTQLDLEMTVEYSRQWARAGGGVAVFETKRKKR
ncbi:MAG: aminomethyltransferase family protein [Caldilineaceae bacterium]